MAGTRTRRTTVASTSTATARPRPNTPRIRNGSPITNEPKTQTMTAAAAVITRAVPASPLALLDASIAGDEAVALQDRPHIRALLADQDPRNQLSGLAGLIRGIMARAEPCTGSSSAQRAPIPTLPRCSPN